MSHEPGDEYADIRRQYETSEGLRDQHDDKRRLLVEMQYRLHAMELQLAATEEELRSLEGLSLSRIIHTLKGDHASRVDAARQAMAALNVQYDSAESALHSLLTQIAEMETDVGAQDGTRAEYEAAFPSTAMVSEPEDTEAARQLRELNNRLGAQAVVVRVVQRAIASGERARAELLQTKPPPGLPRPDGVRAQEIPNCLSPHAPDGQGTQREVDRIVIELREYLARFNESLGAMGTEGDESARRLLPALSGAADAFSRNRLLEGADETGSIAALDALLVESNMVLEQCLNRTKAAIAQLESDRRKLASTDRHPGP